MSALFATELMAAPASAHGAMMVPGSRTFLCWRDGLTPQGNIVPQNPAAGDGSVHRDLRPDGFLVRWLPGRGQSDQHRYVRAQRLDGVVAARDRAEHQQPVERDVHTRRVRRDGA
jgi:hypothetical protein